MSDPNFQISVVLPCFNVIGHLEKSLNSLVVALDSQLKSWEIIVVDDGSHDGTSSIAKSFARPTLRSIKFDKNRGKYAAIKCGIEASKGDVVVFTDSDLPYGTEGIFQILGKISAEGFQIVVGDRTNPNSTAAVSPPLIRKIASKVFSTISKKAFEVRVSDTQCGLKGFSTPVAKKLFRLIKDNRFGGDLELLYLASKYQLRIATVPVHLTSAGKSSVNVLTDGIGVLSRAILTVLFWKIGRYPKSLD